MSQYAAFLRGVNLGPKRRVTSAGLRSLFEEMGFSEADTFRTSGNVVFGARREPQAKIAARIERGLEESLGFQVSIFLRTAGEVRALAAHEPFPHKLVEASKGKLQVAMLESHPPSRARRDVLAMGSDEDRLAFGDRELFWLPSAGTRDSSLDLKAIEKQLGATTMRTKETIDKLAAKFFAG